MAKDQIQKVRDNLKYSMEKLYPLHKAIKNDFKFVQGKQWDEADLDALREQGVKGLTINKLKPIIKLITGIERQSRTDYKIMPEGEEDNLVAAISTRLIKNIAKTSKLQDKQSIQFKNGCIGGSCFLEPYISYNRNILTGDLEFKKISAQDVFYDPDGEEYDLSDHRFVIKVTRQLSEDDLIALFPEKESVIKNLPYSRIGISETGLSGDAINGEHYPALGSGTQVETDSNEPTYDLIDHYEKELVKGYFVVDVKTGELKKVIDKKAAEDLVADSDKHEVLERKVIQIKLTQVVGEEILYEGPSWALPKWDEYPIIPFFAELVTEEVDDRSLNVQGIVRGITDLQEEYNKRRTQELRHLNSSANSGFDIEEGQYTKEEESKLKRFGSSAGIVAKRKKGSAPLQRITPMPLSQGHAQLAGEHSEDMKEASGVNPNLLSSDSNSQSGRALLFKQRQGMVMIQEYIDNFNRTKKITGQFIVSQLGEVFTPDSAIKVLGKEFIADNFTTPVTYIIDRGLSKLQAQREDLITDLEEEMIAQYPDNDGQKPVVDDKNKLVTAVDIDTAREVIEFAITDKDVMRYDIAVGEGPFSETIRMANFMDLKELAQQGVQIPPATLLENSMLPDSEKKKIAGKLEAQQQAMAQQGQAEMQMEDKHHTEEINIDQQKVDIEKFLAQIKAFESQVKGLSQQGEQPNV